MLGMKLFFRRAHLNSSPAVPGSNGVCGLSLPGSGMAFAGTLVSARWRSRCAKRGLRQAGCVAARPAAGCSRLQSFICCGPTIPQVWPAWQAPASKPAALGRTAFMVSGCSSVLSGRRGSGEIRFMVGSGRPKADHVGFW